MYVQQKQSCFKLQGPLECKFFQDNNMHRELKENNSKVPSLFSLLLSPTTNERELSAPSPRELTFLYTKAKNRHEVIFKLSHWLLMTSLFNSDWLTVYARASQLAAARDST
jgi:hypothetical protein